MSNLTRAKRRRNIGIVLLLLVAYSCGAAANRGLTPHTAGTLSDVAVIVLSLVALALLIPSLVLFRVGAHGVKTALKAAEAEAEMVRMKEEHRRKQQLEEQRRRERGLPEEDRELLRAAVRSRTAPVQSQCSACGGELEPLAEGGMRCPYCGRKA